MFRIRPDNAGRRAYAFVLTICTVALIAAVPTSALSATSTNNIPTVDPTPPPKSNWLTLILGWALWIGLGLVTLYFIIAAVKAVQAIGSSRGSADKAVKQGIAAIVALVVFSSLTPFLGSIVGAF